MEKTVRLAGFMGLLSQSVKAYDPNILNPGEKIIPSEFVPRWIDAFIRTIQDPTLSGELPKYTILIIIISLLVLAAYLLKRGDR